MAKRWKLLKQMLILFIVIQPFLDVYYLYQAPLTDIFKFSPATIIRLIFIAILGVTYLISNKQKKWNYFLFGYIGLAAVYFVIHHLNAGRFTSLVDGNFNYSAGSELFYIVRLLIPLFVIVLAYQIEINDRLLERITQWLIALISGSIVITNIFKIGLGSYTNVRISGSFFNWFVSNHRGSYFQLASKGFFNFANSTSAVLLMLTPILFYFLVKDCHWPNITLVILHTLAMFMLGTKVASLGFIGVLLVSCGIYGFFIWGKKEFKFSKRAAGMFMLLVVMSGIILPFSPTLNRSSYDAQIQEERDGDKEDVKEREKELEKERKKHTTKKKDTPLIKYIRKNYSSYSINWRFIEISYPYYDDPDFWANVMKWPINDRLNYRKVEQAMLDRVKEVNKNKVMDNMFGITYTRMTNIFSLERDFVSQFYSIGLVGVLIFIMPYLLLFFYAVFLLFRHFKKNFTYRNVNLVFAIGLILLVSMYSGNVMDFLTATILLAFFEGQTIRRLRNVGPELTVIDGGQDQLIEQQPTTAASEEEKPSDS